MTAIAPPLAYVFDTGPLSHFAKAQWLGVLKAIIGNSHALIPDVVETELRAGLSSHPYLQAVIDQSWIEVVPLDLPEHLAALAKYSVRLVGADGRNLGEAGVLALAEIVGGIAVVDDRVAVNAAKSNNVRVRRTLGLLCDALRTGMLTVPLVSAIADDLLINQYRLPFKVGGFAEWAASEGILPEPRDLR